MWWIVGVALALSAVFWVTLRPSAFKGYPTGANWKPLEHHGQALQALKRETANHELILYYLASDVGGNMLLFVPVGLFLAGALGGRHPAVRLFGACGLAVLLSVAIEIVQLHIPGRATDVDDVIFNGVGALLGASALLVGERVRDGRR